MSQERNNERSERPENSSDRDHDSRSKPLGFEKAFFQEKGFSERGSDRGNDSHDKPLGFEKSSVQEKGPTERGQGTRRDLSSENRTAPEIRSRTEERLSNPSNRIPKGNDASSTPREEDWNKSKQDERNRIRCRQTALTPLDLKIGEYAGKLGKAGAVLGKVAWDLAKAVETGVPPDPARIVNLANSTERIVGGVVSSAAREIRCLPDTAKHYGDPPAWNSGGQNGR